MSSLLTAKNKQLNLKIRRGYTYNKTFLKRHNSSYEADPLGAFENDGFQAQLDVYETTDVLLESYSTEDSGGQLVIDEDIILIGFSLTPSETQALDYVCVSYELYIYKGSIEDPDPKYPIAQGKIEVI